VEGAVTADAAGTVGPPVSGPSSEPLAASEVSPPRLARYRLQLPSGREVGVAIAGRGVPLVVVHGFAAEGILYAQTLSRLVKGGFRVIAIDSPGHGGTDSIGMFAPLGDYTGLLRETLDHLGVREAVLVGHSMGGRLVADLAANEPGRAIAVVLVDAIVGDVWDCMVSVFRLAPATYASFGVGLLADTVTTLPLWSDPRQAVKLARLVFPTGANHVRRPWRLAGPLLSILRSTPSQDGLDRLRDHGVPVVVVHGDRDFTVPICTARAAAERSGGDLLVVHGARHSWLLRDPETFPAILAELGEGKLGAAIAAALDGHALDAGADTDAVEAALYAPGARVLALTPSPPVMRPSGRHRAPRYRWSRPGARGAGAARLGLSAQGDGRANGGAASGHGAANNGSRPGSPTVPPGPGR
jgi:pimeloyl-ACP methyl ester carboxylesterase